MCCLIFIPLSNFYLYVIYILIKKKKEKEIPSNELNKKVAYKESTELNDFSFAKNSDGYYSLNVIAGELVTNEESKDNQAPATTKTEEKDLTKIPFPYYMKASLAEHKLEKKAVLRIENLDFAKKEFNILEIGARGGTFLLFSQLSTGKKIAVDIDTSFKDAMQLSMIGEDFHFLNEDSQSISTFEKIKAICPSFDFIFIDGDHTYEGVKKDFELYSTIMSDNGIMILHDTDKNYENSLIVTEDEKKNYYRFGKIYLMYNNLKIVL